LEERTKSETNRANGTELLTAPEVAQRLGVSESWVRRHASELPIVRVGRLIRFDGSLISERFNGTLSAGKSLKPERAIMPSRFQRGYVFQKGKKLKTWYGVYREDVRTPAEIKRVQRKVRLGTLAELPTKNAARNKLTDLLSGREEHPAAIGITFEELVERWREAEGPTMKESTLSHYVNALRGYVTPFFGTRKIASINREDIQRFLVEKAKSFSLSTLRSMKVSLGLTLGWAEACGWIPKSPCIRLKLPKETGGRRVARTVLTPKQIGGIVQKLEEPYATLVLFLATTGLRIGEAIAVKWSDFEGTLLTVSRRIYNGDVDTVKSIRSVRKLSVESGLMERIQTLRSRFASSEWVFCSEVGTPVNPGNSLGRYLRPAAIELGIALGGWHDFRHTLSTTLRKAGVHPKVVSDILGHSKVNLAMDVYDRTDAADFTAPLTAVANELLPNVTQNESAA